MSPFLTEGDPSEFRPECSLRWYADHQVEAAKERAMRRIISVLIGALLAPVCAAAANP